jgi:hypothetical protein
MAPAPANIALIDVQGQGRLAERDFVGPEDIQDMV